MATENQLSKNIVPIIDISNTISSNNLIKLMGLAEVERDPISEFWENPSFSTFFAISKNNQTEDMIKAVILSNDPFIDLYGVLKYASKRKMTYDICIKACRRNGRDLRYVPKKFLNRDMYMAAISSRRNKILSQVPEEQRDYEMCLFAVQNDGSRDGSVLKSVPKSLLKGDKGRVICEKAVDHNGLAADYVPKKYLTKDMREARNKAQREFDLANTKKQNRFSAIGASQASSNVAMVFRKAPQLGQPKEILPIGFLEKDSEEVSTIYNSNEETQNKLCVYYITDIHIEHQIKFSYRTTYKAVKQKIDDKIDELHSSINSFNGVILVGGDVADSIELVKIFYTELRKSFPEMSIFSVLGNHELWNGNSREGTDENIDDLINLYRTELKKEKITLIENGLLFLYKGETWGLIDEKTLLESDEKDLAEICIKSNLLILGGLGFSGLNPKFNADQEFIYRKIINRNEDIARSKRFKSVYDKMIRCAGNRKIIVLTHTPMRDWSSSPYNPNWIYISGHTHQNTFCIEENGTTVLSDNQIGYKPKEWNFNQLILDGFFDPFANQPDGIYKISTKQYLNFNRGRGIHIDFKSKGYIYMLKRNNNYMFLLCNSNKLYLLEGGRINLLKHDMHYYYENIPLYCEKVKQAFEPYQTALSIISHEVKSFGGDGGIHGCIVDVDFYNHIYLNPYNGKLHFYYATSTSDRKEFKTIDALLRNSPFPPISSNGTKLLDSYRKATDDEKTPVLAVYNIHKESTLATIPDVFLDISMYKPSNIMRKIQYVLEHDVIRIWRDEVLMSNSSKTVQDNKSTLSLHVDLERRSSNLSRR